MVAMAHLARARARVRVRVRVGVRVEVAVGLGCDGARLEDARMVAPRGVRDVHLGALG